MMLLLMLMMMSPLPNIQQKNLKCLIVLSSSERFSVCFEKIYSYTSFSKKIYSDQSLLCKQNSHQFTRQFTGSGQNNEAPYGKTCTVFCTVCNFSICLTNQRWMR